MWIKEHLELGDLKAGVEILVEFRQKRIIKGFEVLSLESSCGCSRPEYMPEEGRVLVKFKPKPVPQHILQSGRDTYTSTKRIKLKTSRGKMELTFRSTIRK